MLRGTTMPEISEDPGFLPRNSSGDGIGMLGFGMTIGMTFLDWSNIVIWPPAYRMQLIELISVVSGFDEAMG
jgi:TM2 domain-containing membrane protein YozV